MEGRRLRRTCFAKSNWSLPTSRFGRLTANRKGCQALSQSKGGSPPSIDFGPVAVEIARTARFRRTYSSLSVAAGGAPPLALISAARF